MRLNRGTSFASLASLLDEKGASSPMSAIALRQETPFSMEGIAVAGREVERREARDLYASEIAVEES